MLQCPGIRNKVVSVHSRKAEREVVEELTNAGLTAVLHWFVGGQRATEAAVAAGMFFSVNSRMLDSARGRLTVGLVPRDRVLTETDGPYAQGTGGPQRPTDIPRVVAELARLWDCEPEDARALVWANMAGLYKARVADGPQTINQAGESLP